jgi:hypothetical protein
MLSVCPLRAKFRFIMLYSKSALAGFDLAVASHKTLLIAKVGRLVCRGRVTNDQATAEACAALP